MCRSISLLFWLGRVHYLLTFPRPCWWSPTSCWWCESPASPRGSWSPANLTEGALLFRSCSQVAVWRCGLAHPVAPCTQCRARGGGGVVDAPGRPLVTCFPQPRLSYQEFQPYLSFAATRSSFNKILDQVDPNSLYLHCHSFYWHFDAWPARPRFFLAFSLPKCHSYRSCNNLQLL